MKLNKRITERNIIMAKLTKKSYQRKAMVMGGIIFASCALFATGFAAFVVSSSASHGIGGKVNVGTISDKSITFTDVALSAPNFSFDAKKDDNSGRVRWDGTNSENLKTTVTGKFSPSDYVNEFTVELRLGNWDDSNKDVTVDTKAEARIDAAVAAGYIVAPRCYKNPVPLLFSGEGAQITETGENGVKVASFTYEIAFQWGEHFKGMNPSEFYDQTGIASSYPDEGEKSYRNDLNKFYKTMTGVESGSSQTPLEMNFCVKLVASTSGTRS